MHTCPKCNNGFKRRSKGGCPHCGEPLVLKNGEVYRASDWGDSKALLRTFLQELNTRREANGLAILWFPTGSKSWIGELFAARQIIARASQYLLASSKRELYDPTEFAKFVIQHLFSEMRSSEWLVANADSIRTCNGRLFSSAAPKVLNILEGERKKQELSKRQLHDIRMDDMDVQYAL